jgi:hypothetical protein
MAKFFTDETPFRASDAQNELEVSILGLSAGGLSSQPLILLIYVFLHARHHDPNQL